MGCLQNYTPTYDAVLVCWIHALKNDSCGADNKRTTLERIANEPCPCDTCFMHQSCPKECRAFRSYADKGSWDKELTGVFSPKSRKKKVKKTKQELFEEFIASV